MKSYNQYQHKLLILLALFAIVGCGSIPVEQRDEYREQIDSTTEETLARLTDQYPEFEEAFESAEGFLAVRMSGAVAMVGGGVGLGVLVDNATGSRTYMDATRVDLGIGAAAGTYSYVVLFETRETLEQFQRGVWRTGLGVETAAGQSNAMLRSSLGPGKSVFVLTDTGAAVSATARVTRISVNNELTDTGVSNVSIPNTGFSQTERQIDHAPRRWRHRLPFMAQQVIDLGYDLPLPYGVGLTFVNVEQDMLLDELEVGINGNEKELFDWVEFRNARAENDSLQLKLDAWLFPFMNVFALLGKIDGSAPMDVVLDGNGMLDQLETDCSGIIKPPLCFLLQDQTFVLPIRAPFSGNTYGIGTVLAGGWNDWFAVLPISFTIADMDGTDTDGAATTITPRVGRTFDFGRKGVLSAFVGGNYLDAAVSVDGQVQTPDGLLVIDYTIEQENTDRWNAVVGGNWDLSKRMSIMAEYNGFTGSREAWIASFVYRF